LAEALRLFLGKRKSEWRRSICKATRSIGVFIFCNAFEGTSRNLQRFCRRGVSFFSSLYYNGRQRVLPFLVSCVHPFTQLDLKLVSSYFRRSLFDVIIGSPRLLVHPSPTLSDLLGQTTALYILNEEGDGPPPLANIRTNRISPGSATECCVDGSIVILTDSLFSNSRE